MQSLYPYLICKPPYNPLLFQLLFLIFFTTYCCYNVVQLGMLNYHLLLLCNHHPNPSIPINQPYICAPCFFFVDSYESLLGTLVFLNDHSTIQVKLIFCGSVFLSKVSHCISLFLLYVCKCLPV